MSEIRVQCLRASDGEKYQAQHGETDETVVQEECDAMRRVEGGKNAWLLHDANDAHDHKDRKPHENDRPKQGGYPRSATTLNGKEPDQD